MCHGQGCRGFVGDKRDLPPLMTESLFHGHINPYYYWVDDHPLLYGNNGSLDPGTYNPQTKARTIPGVSSWKSKSTIF